MLLYKVLNHVNEAVNYYSTKSQSDWDGVLTRFSSDLYVLLTCSKILALENLGLSSGSIYIFHSNQCTSVE